MKEYDSVRLIKNKKQYADEGVFAGDEGVILGEKRNGCWLVYFNGEIKQYDDGTYYTTEKDVAVLEEDLEVVWTPEDGWLKK